MFENIFTKVFRKNRGRSASRDRQSASLNQASGSDSISGSDRQSSPSFEIPQVQQIQHDDQPPKPFPRTRRSFKSIYPTLPVVCSSLADLKVHDNQRESQEKHKFNYAPILEKSPPLLDSGEFFENNPKIASNLDELFSGIQKVTELVDRVDNFLQSKYSDYDFNDTIRARDLLD